MVWTRELERGYPVLGLDIRPSVQQAGHSVRLTSSTSHHKRRHADLEMAGSHTRP
jgi:hypothetical protein